MNCTLGKPISAQAIKGEMTISIDIITWIIDIYLVTWIPFSYKFMKKTQVVTLK